MEKKTKTNVVINTDVVSTTGRSRNVLLEVVSKKGKKSMGGCTGVEELARKYY